MKPSDVTLVRNAIHNPNDARHFMRVVPAGTMRSASVDSTLIAQSADALIVKEIGLDFYDPVVYFPRIGVNMDLLASTEKTTHCPLKGSTEYFDIVVAGMRISDAAWSYTSTIKDAAELRDLIAFDSDKITID